RSMTIDPTYPSPSGSPPIPSRSWSSANPAASRTSGPIATWYVPAAESGSASVIRYVAPPTYATPLTATAPAGPLTVTSDAVNVVRSTGLLKITSTDVTFPLVSTGECDTTAGPIGSAGREVSHAE